LKAFSLEYDAEKFAWKKKREEVRALVLREQIRMVLERGKAIPARSETDLSPFLKEVRRYPLFLGGVLQLMRLISVSFR
jgi:hypothetical protein